MSVLMALYSWVTHRSVSSFFCRHSDNWPLVGFLSWAHNIAIDPLQRWLVFLPNPWGLSSMGFAERGL